MSTETHTTPEPTTLPDTLDELGWAQMRLQMIAKVIRDTMQANETKFSPSLIIEALTLALDIAEDRPATEPSDATVSADARTEGGGL